MSVLIIGIPPATAASNSILTLFLSASNASWSPYFDIKDLLAVTTCFFLLIESKTSFLAGPSAPPISSMTISISSSLDASK